MTKRERYAIASVIARAPASVLARALQVARTDPATPGPYAGSRTGDTRSAGELPTARKRPGAAGVRGAVVPIAQSRRSSRANRRGGALG